MHRKLIRAVQRREAVERIAQRFIEAVIRKEKGEYCVRSPNNPDWNGGCYPSEAKAEERLHEVEFFKRQAKLRVRDQVTLPKGHKVGMGHLKQDTQVTVESVHQGDEGEFYRVAWTDPKGRPRTTYIREGEIKLATRQAAVGDPTYPKDHRFGLKVPKGGSSCAKCFFISKDGKHCGSDYFQHWQKSLDVEDPSLIPGPADAYCCDVFRAMP
jgi:hypothetical protein